MNGKIAEFVICVEAIIYYFHDWSFIYISGIKN